MVTAILIPIVVIYFYWLTKKEMQANYDEWVKLEDIPEEALISGKIIELQEQKERFYYHRFNHVWVLRVQTDIKELTVKKITPMRKGLTPPDFKEGEWVHLYGNWKEGYFAINRAVKQEKGA